MLNEEINYHNAFIGTNREDNWTPYLDEENYWVQTGEDAGRPCQTEGSDGNWHARGATAIGTRTRGAASMRSSAAISSKTTRPVA